jgi:hypothetical protein
MATRKTNSTPRPASPRKATAKRQAPPKAAATAIATKAKATPEPTTTDLQAFAKDQVVTANHPRLHPTEGPATVRRDHSATDTYIQVAFIDDGQAITVHRHRIKVA